MKIHSDDKPFKCDFCDYRAKRKADLKTHVHAIRAGRPHRKRAEVAVASFFDSLAGSYLREYQIPFEPGMKKKFARVDFLLQKEWGWLVLEVDERQHRSKSQYDIEWECTRMILIFKYFIARQPNSRLHIVRYNAHPYLQDGIVAKPRVGDRNRSLSQTLDHVPEGMLTITYFL